MYRFAIEKLQEWKASKYRKPMIIEGVCQVGKTWLMWEFERIILGLELYVGRKINAENTLIICAGSLLGIALHGGTSFPVGKVDFVKLYPLSFREFLTACGKERFVKLMDDGDYTMVTSFKQTYIDLLKQYYFVGGMP